MHVICYKQDTEWKFHVVYIGRSQYHTCSGNSTHLQLKFSCMLYMFTMNLQVGELYLFYTSHNMLNQNLTSIDVLCNCHMLLLRLYSHICTWFVCPNSNIIYIKMLLAIGCEVIWCVHIKQHCDSCQPTGYKTEQQSLLFSCALYCVPDIRSWDVLFCSAISLCVDTVYWWNSNKVVY
jgi:hypothetical protein